MPAGSASFGTLALILVAPSFEMLATVPLNVTCRAPERFVPVIDTVVPTAADSSVAVSPSRHAAQRLPAVQRDHVAESGDQVDGLPGLGTAALGESTVEVSREPLRVEQAGEVA